MTDTAPPAETFPLVGGVDPALRPINPRFRVVDHHTHLLEQAVLSAAVLFVEVDPDGPAEERIVRHRMLRDRVRAYLEHAEQG